jgi:hypothetical protein
MSDESATTGLEEPVQDGTKVEVDFGPNAILVLTVPAAMTIEQIQRMRSAMLEIVEKPGPQVVVLANGTTCQILHRPVPAISEGIGLYDAETTGFMTPFVMNNGFWYFYDFEGVLSGAYVTRELATLAIGARAPS